MEKFKLCKECKAGFLRDLENRFSSSKICGECFAGREIFIKEAVEGLREAFLSQGGPNISNMNIGLILEKWLEDS